MALTLSANVNGLSAIDGNPVAFNDIYLDKFGNISLSIDLQATLEECAQAARTLLGECVLNVNIGIPYQQNVWTGVPNIEQFDAALRQAFLNCDNVLDVVSLSIVKGQNSQTLAPTAADVLSYTAVIRTSFGTGTVNG